jgi:hypothetical protein
MQHVSKKEIDKILKNNVSSIKKKIKYEFLNTNFLNYEKQEKI